MTGRIGIWILGADWFQYLCFLFYYGASNLVTKEREEFSKGGSWCNTKTIHWVVQAKILILPDSSTLSGDTAYQD